MKNEIKLFNFEGHKVRTVIIDGEVWFVARDVAETLGYKDTINAIKQHCKRVAKHHLPTTSGMQAFSVIPEPDVYRLIMRSKLPSAEKFEEWVFGDVLPTIRKTGKYETAPQYYIPKDYAEALQLAATQAKQITEQQVQIEHQGEEIKKAAPKVKAFDDFITSEGYQTLDVVAKALDVGVNRLFKFLRLIGIMRSNRLPMQPYIERGYFTVHVFPYYGTKKVQNRGKTLVSPRGVEYIRRKIKKHHALAKEINLFIGHKKGGRHGEI